MPLMITVAKPPALVASSILALTFCLGLRPWGSLYFHSIEAFSFSFFCFLFMGSLARLFFYLAQQEFGVPKLDVREDELTTFSLLCQELTGRAVERLDDLVVGD